MSRIEDFIRERQYLMSVSDNTIRWHHFALKWLPNENPTEQELKQMVIRMREKGLKETGCNAVIRSVNAYLKWSGSPQKIKPLREPKEVMPTFSLDQVRLLIKFKPKTEFERRLHLLVLILLDTGARISEVLGLKWNDVDFDNLLLTVHGKGGKDRKIPISFELRKVLYGQQRGNAQKSKPLVLCELVERSLSGSVSNEALVFSTSQGTPWSRIGALRAVKLHCQRLGFEPPARTLHAVRRTFATTWIQRGGSLPMLQRILGHANISTTMVYLNLQTADLVEAHRKVSLLSC